jgi:hypothetical protein
MSAGTAALLLLAFASQPSDRATCEQLRADADRVQGEMDAMITDTVGAELASMRGRRDLRAQQRAAELASNVPVVGGYIADAVTIAGEARQAQLEARSDETGERMAEAAPDLGRRAADLELAYEMRCRRPAAAQAQEARP